MSSLSFCAIPLSESAEPESVVTVAESSCMEAPVSSEEAAFSFINDKKNIKFQEKTERIQSFILLPASNPREPKASGASTSHSPHTSTARILSP